MPAWFGLPSWWSGSQTAATTSTTSIWQPLGTVTTGLTAPTIVWSAVSDPTFWDQGTTATSCYTATNTAYENALLQQQLAMQAAQHRYEWQMIRMDNRALYMPSAPAIITRQEEERRDREALWRAIEEHDAQEAARIQRQIELRERATAEERRLHEERMEAERQRRQRWEQAKGVARELLLEHLTPRQRETFLANGWFVVEGGRSKTQYRIRAAENMVANVDVLRNGRTDHRLCAHVPLGTVPLGDQLLAQKIMLELAEDDFLRKANRHAA